MTAYLVTHTTRGGVRTDQRIEARTPEAAVRQVYGKNTSFGAERDTMAGAVRALTFSTVRGNGEVTWAKAPGVVLVRHAYRVDDAPFWTDPEQWTDHDTHPLTVLS